MSERLALRGFKVVPHVAAKMVQDKAHLREIIAHLNDLPVISIFVPGGDAETAVLVTTRQPGRCCATSRTSSTSSPRSALAAHPEGHPAVSNEVLLDELLKKQELVELSRNANVF